MPRHKLQPTASDPMASMPTSSVPPAYLVRYFIGLVIVVGGLIASSILTGHQLANLVSTAKGIPACGAAPGPNCLTVYPATVEQLLQSSDSSNVTVVLHSSFLASTDDRDECFGTACIDYVPVSGGAAGRLSAPEQASITAGDGRVVSIATADGSITTQDSPGVSILQTLADLVGALYLTVLLTLFGGGYLVLAIRIGIWRIHPLRWLRAVTATQILTGVLSLAALIGFALRNSAGLAILAVVALVGFAGSHLARRHARRPPAMVPSGGPTQRDVAFADRHWGSLIAAFYLLAAFPVPIGISVALLLIHDGDSIGGVIAAVVGIALGAFIVFRLYRSVHRAPAARRARAVLR
jgi:hypothetical protein